MLRWGETTCTITIARSSFIPDGRIHTNGALLRQRYALDIDGGTTDFTGRKGLELLPGSEGGARQGVQNAAETARALIQRRFPSLRQPDAGQVLAMLCQTAKKPPNRRARGLFVWCR